VRARLRHPVLTRFRRSPFVVGYWQPRARGGEGELVLHQFARGTRTVAPAAAIAVLDAAHAWTSAVDLARVLPGVSTTAIATLLDGLVRRGLLEREGARVHPRDAAAAGWAAWNPAGGFFHQATRDVRFSARADANAFLRRRARATPPPVPVHVQTRATARDVRELPPPSLTGELARTLRARRSWRRIGRGPIAVDTLATLLGLTWGVQAWVDVDGFGRMPLKTSPSGGARHSVEAYIAVRRVNGLTPGLYHYEAGAHRLVRLPGRLTGRALAACVPHQTWMATAPVLVFMTAVFARAQWRYQTARAYRTVLAEVGHHAQTFCLLATARTLAPFCTMALADSAVERLLGVDGIREAALYAVGVGERPAGVDWAPWPHTTRRPRRVDVVPGRSDPE
jgi:SagB-type dehydrogenase family enzyme